MCVCVCENYVMENNFQGDDFLWVTNISIKDQENLNLFKKNAKFFEM